MITLLLAMALVQTPAPTPTPTPTQARLRPDAVEVRFATLESALVGTEEGTLRCVLLHGAATPKPATRKKERP